MHLSFFLPTRKRIPEWSRAQAGLPLVLVPGLNHPLRMRLPRIRQVRLWPEQPMAPRKWLRSARLSPPSRSGRKRLPRELADTPTHPVFQRWVVRILPLDSMHERIRRSRCCLRPQPRSIPAGEALLLQRVGG